MQWSFKKNHVVIVQPIHGAVASLELRPCHHVGTRRWQEATHAGQCQEQHQWQLIFLWQHLIPKGIWRKKHNPSWLFISFHIHFAFAIENKNLTIFFGDFRCSKWFPISHHRLLPPHPRHLALHCAERLTKSNQCKACPNSIIPRFNNKQCDNQQKDQWFQSTATMSHSAMINWSLETVQRKLLT